MSWEIAEKKEPEPSARPVQVEIALIPVYISYSAAYQNHILN